MSDETTAVETGGAVTPAAPENQSAPPAQEQHSNAEWAKLRLAEKAAKEAEAGQKAAEARAAELEKELQNIKSNAVSKEQASLEVEKLIELNAQGLPLTLRDMVNAPTIEGAKDQIARLRQAIPVAQPPAATEAPAQQAQQQQAPPASVSAPPPPRREPEVRIEDIRDPAEQKKAYRAEWDRQQREKLG